MGTTGNGQRFMAAFTTIEEKLRREVGADRNIPFKSVLGKVNARRLAHSQRDALTALTDLRNAIVHERYHNGEPAADPHDEVVADIEALAREVATPMTVMSALHPPKPSVVDSRTPIPQALTLMHERDYSQLPVYDGGSFTGLLTTNTIARWIAAQFADLGDLAEAEIVGVVLHHQESSESVNLVSRTITCVEAIDRLAPAGNAARPSALIVTANGNATDAPLGIVTASDVGALHAAL